MRSEYHPSQLDHLRRTTTEQAAEIQRLRTELAQACWHAANLEMQLAIAKGDKEAWGAALRKREAVS